MRNFFFIVLAQCWLLIWQNAAASSLPKHLIFSENTVELQLRYEDGEDANIGTPVSVVRIDGQHIAVAAYLRAWIINEDTGKVKEIPKPEGVDLWYPTGLAWDNKKSRLYIANYLGKDILILGRAGNGNFFLDYRITDADIVGTENIALSPDGNYFAVADFDNNGVALFQVETNRKVWFRKLGRAHGIDFESSGNSLVATGLNPPAVVRFDIDGNLQSSQVASGWERDAYLWPTGVSTNPLTGETWVADAHLGRVRQIDPMLREQRSLGGNGLGPMLFNMPYGIWFEQDGRLWITDTFKSRVLLLDRNGHVVKIFKSGSEHIKLTEVVAEKKNLKANAAIYEPMGRSYSGRIDLGTNVMYGFGLSAEQSPWSPGFSYSAFSEKHGRQLALAGSSPVFSSSFYYWIQALRTEDGLLYGSPQTREWIADFNGLACPVHIGLNYWLLKSGVLLTDQGPSHLVSDIFDICRKRISAFKRAVQNGIDVLSAYSVHVLSKPVDITKNKLKFIFQSEKGKAFYMRLCKERSDLGRRELSINFIADLAREKFVFLPELWIAKIFSNTSMMLPNKDNLWSCSDS